MSIWGAIVGGAAGFALGGPLGGILGAALGHAAERAGQQSGLLPGGEAATASRDNTKRIAFTIAVIVLGAKMAKADGRVTRDEVNTFKQVFRVPSDQTQNVARIFNAARQDSSGYEPYARQIAGMFQDRPVVLEELLSCLFAIAKADGEVHAAEVTFLADVARLFGLDEAAFERLRNQEIGPDRADPYTILGVTRSDDDATIKRAYRTLVREHHPDRLVAEGMPQEFIDVATDKLARINAAYERIQADRGLD